MDVFEVFPQGIVLNEWYIGQLERGTVRGKEFSNPITCDVIVDEGTYAVTDRSPSAEYEDSDTLLYARPEQMPTTDTAALSTGYIWWHKPSNQYYEIREASLGKNQENGSIEHIEFLLRPTEVALVNTEAEDGEQ